MYSVLPFWIQQSSSVFSSSWAFPFSNNSTFEWSGIFSFCRKSAYRNLTGISVRHVLVEVRRISWRMKTVKTYLYIFNFVCATCCYGNILSYNCLNRNIQFIRGTGCHNFDEYPLDSLGEFFINDFQTKRWRHSFSENKTMRKNHVPKFWIEIKWATVKHPITFTVTFLDGACGWKMCLTLKLVK